MIKKLCLILLLLICYEADNLTQYEEDYAGLRYELAFKDGLINQIGGRYVEAFKDFTRAYSFLENESRYEDRLNCLKQLGILCWNLGEIDKSYGFFYSALSIEERVKINERNPFCANALAVISLYKEGRRYREEGQAINSKDCFRLAIELSKNIQCPEFELKCIRQLSISHWALKEVEEFRYLNEVGLSIARRIGHKNEEGRCLNNIGIYFKISHDYLNALSYFELAVEQARKWNYKENETECLNNIGLLFCEVGEYEKAVLYLGESLRIDQEEKRLAGVVVTACNLGAAYLEKYRENQNKSDLRKAIGYLEKCIKLDSDHISEEIEIAALNNLGVASYELGEYNSAFQFYADALKTKEQDYLIEEKARIYINLGAIYYKQEKIEEAQNCFEKSLQNQLDNLRFPYKWEAYFGLGNCYLKKDKMLMAVQCYEKAIENIENINNHISFDLFKIGFFKSKYEVYQQLINTLYMGYKENPSVDILLRMLFVIEKAKAQIFLESLIKASSNIESGSDPISYYKENRDPRPYPDISELTEYNLQMERSSPKKEKTREYGIADQRDASAIDQQFQSLIKNGFMNFLDFCQICKGLLRSNAIFLEYWLGEKQSLLFYLSKDSIQLIELESKKEIYDAIRGYIKVLSSPAEDSSLIKNVSRRIKEKIIGSVLDKTNGSVTNLIIVPDGILSYLPFETLLINNTSKAIFLIERFSISYSPSIAALYFLDSCWGKKKYRKPLLAFGAPERRLGGSEKDKTDSGYLRTFTERYPSYKKDLHKLPFSKKEIDNIIEYFGEDDCDIFVGSEASKNKVRSLNLEEYQIIHFACHGIINEQNPIESALVLSNNPEQDDDGLIRMSEVYDLKISAELVILSSCNSATGKLDIGAGIASIARCFFGAGARTVIASLWSIKDSAASEIMNYLYRELSYGKSKSDALRRAKIEIIRSKNNHPYYWAGFVLCGDYDNTINKLIE